MSAPTPILLALTSASLCMLNVVVFPDLLSDWKVSSLFILFSSIIFAIYGAWHAFIYPSWSSPLRGLPKPESGAVPIIGYPAVTLRRQATDLFLKFMIEVPNEGLIRFPGVFNQNCLLPTDPLALADVFVNNSYDFEKPSEIRKFLRIVLGDGLIMVEGDEHKFQRKHSSPAFSFRHIKELYPIFWRKARDLTACIAAEIHENPEPTHEKDSKQCRGVVEINHWANKVTMDIIGIAGLGREFNTLHSTDDELIAAYEEILEPTTEKAVYFAMNLLFSQSFVAKIPWKLNQRFKANTIILRDACNKLVRDKKESIAKREEKHIDILSLLIKSNNFADEMLVDQLLTYLAAGHETTSSAFTWGTYLLAKNPEVQTRLREEIRANLPSPSAAPDPSIDIGSILESLPYLHGVCAEILRLYPPVPTTLRIAVRDTTIASHPVPKGTRIYLSPYGINRSPTLWNEPGEFIPERWFDPSTGKPNNTGGVRSNYNVMTFLHGPRSCIGERFAKSELKALMAVFIGMMATEMADPNQDVTAAGAITLKPKEGMWLRLQVLDGW